MTGLEGQMEPIQTEPIQTEPSHAPCWEQLPRFDERRARAALAMACGGSADRKVADLVASHGPEEVWATLLRGSDDSRWAVRARRVDPAEVERDSQRCGLRFLIPSDPDWPSGLDDLGHCEVGGMGGVPLGLWVCGQGRIDDQAASAVAIVGSRAASHYGEWAAGHLAGEVAQASGAGAGHAVVSGGAYGIDAAAHRGALAVGGKTVAVLAGGLDDVYPRGNARLFQSIRETGLVVSELGPGTAPSRVAFLARNRLIAALSRVTVIVEGAARSGAQNTVAWAQALGRVVAAVPGPISSDRSLTPHRLIRDAEAVLVASGREVLDLVEPEALPLHWQGNSDAGQGSDQGPPSGEPGPRSGELDGLDPDLFEVRESLRRRGGTPLDEVVARTGLRPGVALARLAELEEQGWAQLRSDGSWGLGRPR